MTSHPELMTHHSLGDSVKDDDTTTIDEGLARMMMIMMGRHAETVGNMLRKRADLMNSICRLARHIPRCVLEDVIKSYFWNREHKLSDSLSKLVAPISSIECFNVAETVELTTAESNTAANNDTVALISVTNDGEDPERCSPNKYIDRKNFVSMESPNYLDQLEDEGIDEATTSENFVEANELTSLPFVNYHDCALLFVDISGFTKISQTLDLDPLSEVINDYFDIIVKEVTNHGGDILKFAGDAIFAEWPVGKGATSYTKTCQNLQEAVTIAAVCGARIASACGNVPIYAPVKGLNGDIGIKSMIGTLNVHCGLGAGKVAAVHVGNDTERREFLVLGDPIDQATAACSAAGLGEVAASREAVSYLAELCTFSKKMQVNHDHDTTTIASLSQRYFIPNEKIILNERQRSDTTDLVDAITVSCESLEIADLKDLRLLLALYVHPVVSREEITNSNLHLNAQSTSKDCHIAEAELRAIHTIFIMPLIRAKLTGNSNKDGPMFRLLNSIFLIVSRELEKYHGHLRQFIIDDKGVVLIATFGLRGSTCPNMVSERALPCTTAIHNALQVEIGVENRIGASFGQAYCGIVGGICRHEFAVLGPSVNLSARLMCNSQNPGILVDNKVRLKASKSFSFNALPPVRAKGYASVVPIFEPISANEKTWGKALRDFVGRGKEINIILQVARQVAYSNDKARFVFIQAESGAGKSSLVVRALSSIKKMAIAARKHLIVVRNLSSDSDYMVPFSMFQACFKVLLNEMRGTRGEVNSDLSCSLPYSRDGSDDLPLSSTNSNAGEGSSVTSSSSFVSLKSETCSDVSSAVCSTSLDRLAYLVNELQAPPEFLEIVGGHILRLSGKATVGNQAKNRTGSLDAIVDFMAKAFIRCTSHASLVVLALDDIHHLDELSWKVVEMIFRLGKNLLIIGAARPLKSYKLEVDPVFWSELNNLHSKELRFTNIFLNALSDIEIRDLIAYKLGTRTHEIDKSFYVDLHVRSGGMPHFASQIIENMQRKHVVDILPNGKIGWRTNLKKEETIDFNFTTAEELIVHRIDSLDTLLRQLLHICAVFGREFELSDLIAVCRGWLWKEERFEEASVRKIICALNVAVTEGIIDEVYEGGLGQKNEDFDEELEVEDDTFDVTESDKPKDGNVQYRFRHDTWRENILKLLLDSRKKEIHSTIADSLEKSMNREEMMTNDYCFMVKLFNHRKSSGNTIKASSLALAIGESFVNIFLNNQAINIYNEALAMWLSTSDEDTIDTVAGFPVKVLQSIDPQNLRMIVALHIAKAQCLTNVLKHKDGVQVYNDALTIIKNTPSSATIIDRSYSFPVFSGLFFLLKMGKIEQDNECSYEQGLVEMFVLETRLHGDPVHYGRALGMKAEHFARLGKLSESLDVFHLLAEIYNVDKHSAAICKAYGSDRCAQVFSLSVTWNLLLGNERKAKETCDFVLNNLLGKMDLRNVHNTLMILYPILFVMKDWGEAKRMRRLLNEMIVTPFYEHYGDGGSTPLVFLYKPLDMLLEVCEEGNIDDLSEKVDWILQEGNGLLGDFIDRTMGTSGRTGASITAEICLCLARRVDDIQKKQQLIAKGAALARRSDQVCLRDPKMPFAHAQTVPVLTALEEMVVEFNIPEDMISQKAFDYV